MLGRVFSKLLVYKLRQHFIVPVIIDTFFFATLLWLTWLGKQTQGNQGVPKIQYMNAYVFSLYYRNIFKN